MVQYKQLLFAHAKADGLSYIIEALYIYALTNISVAYYLFTVNNSSIYTSALQLQEHLSVLFVALRAVSMVTVASCPRAVYCAL